MLGLAMNCNKQLYNQSATVFTSENLQKYCLLSIFFIYDLETAPHYQVLADQNFEWALCSCLGFAGDIFCLNFSYCYAHL